MSNLSIQISGFVAGDDLEIRRTVTDLPAAIDVAWLTLKRYADQPDAAARLQKRITTTDVPGTGRVVAAGGAESDGDLRFDLTAADTTLLGAAEGYIYDIQLKLTTGKVYTIEVGTFKLTAGVTETTT